MLVKSTSLLFENKEGIYACVVRSFHPGLEKMSSIWKIWYFHLRLAKPSLNFNSLHRVEILTCNCNGILKWSLLFWRDETSTSSPYNQPLKLLKNPWVTKDITKSSNQKQKLYERFLKTGTPQNDQKCRMYFEYFQNN